MSNQYRTITGFIQFDPTDREVNGKDVRSVVVKQTGLKDQAQNISVTVWDDHAHVALEKGDFVAIDGKFTTNQGKDKEGNPKTYFNLSAATILVIGKGDKGTESETTESDAGDDGEDAW